MLSRYRKAWFFIVLTFFSSYTLLARGLRKVCWPQGVISSTGPEGVWFLSAQNGFCIQNGYNAAEKRTLAIKTMIIRYCNGRMVINSMPLAQKALFISSRSFAMMINGLPCNGIVYIAHKNGLKSYVIVPRSRKTNFLEDIIQPFYDVSKQLFNTISKDLQLLFDAVNENNLRTFRVRVLLKEWESKKEETFCFRSSQGFIISNGKVKKRFKKADLSITVKKGNLYIDNAYCGSSLFLTPIDDHILFNDIPYHGSFFIKKNTTKIQCINYLDVESYVFSVLRTESWPGWPIEVNKAFAIVSRSYVIAAAMKARKNRRSYDVKNTNEHQTYNGVHTSSIIKKAVDETRGVLLGFDNKPILAMFDSCCGGIIPAYIEDFNFAVAPYLARKYACTHCKNCTIYSWEISYNRTNFEQHIGQKIEFFDRLKAIKVTDKDKAGLVQEVTLRGIKKWIKLSGKKVYSLLKEIKSFCFNIRKKGDNIIFKGRGFGHHLGLCQWGAREMVRDGWNYKQILQFYYPETSFMYLI